MLAWERKGKKELRVSRAIKGAESRRRRAARPFGCWTDLVVCYLHLYESPVHSGKMHFPTVGKFMAHGQWRSDVPRQSLRVMFFFPFLSSIPMYLRFLFPSHSPIPIISILCLGKRVAQCVATSQFSNEPPPACRPEANLQGCRWSSQMNCPRWMRSMNELPFKSTNLLRLAQPFHCNIFVAKQTRWKFFVLKTKKCRI